MNVHAAWSATLSAVDYFFAANSTRSVFTSSVHRGIECISLGHVDELEQRAANASDKEERCWHVVEASSC
jgi:hypothetical protein